MHVGILMWRGTRYYDVAAAMEVFSLAFEYQQTRRRVPAVLTDCTGVADCKSCSPTDGIVVVPMDGSRQTSPASQMDLETACHLCDILIIPGFPDSHRMMFLSPTSHSAIAWNPRTVAGRQSSPCALVHSGWPRRACWMAVSPRPIGNIPIAWRNSGPLLPCAITCCLPSRMISGLRRARVLQRMLALNWCAIA